MDQIALVERQIEDGQKLVEQLVRNGFPVAAAFWVNGTEASRWYLYIASPVVDKKGPRAAYGQIGATERQMTTPLGIDPFEVKAIGIKNPIAKDVLAALQQHTGNGPIRYRGARLGPLSIEAAYLYPPPVATRAEKPGNGAA
jgi:hypothetical protein